MYSKLKSGHTETCVIHVNITSCIVLGQSRRVSFCLMLWFVQNYVILAFLCEYNPTIGYTHRKRLEAVVLLKSSVPEGLSLHVETTARRMNIMSVINQKTLDWLLSNLARTLALAVPQADKLYNVMAQGSRSQHQKKWWFSSFQTFSFLVRFSNLNQLNLAWMRSLGVVHKFRYVEIQKFGILPKFCTFPSGMILL